jgi:high-affinity nickel permease
LAGHALGLGFLLGLRHALDADHAAPCPPRQSGTQRAALVPVRDVLGLGHTLDLLVLTTMPSPIGIPFAFTASSSRTFAAALQVVVGACSVLVGALMLV